MSRPELYTDLSWPAAGQIYGLAHATSAARYEIPVNWRDKIVSFTSTQSDLYVVFGDAGVKASTAHSQVVGEVMASNWASCDVVPAGGSTPIYVPTDPSITHYSVISSGTPGLWRARAASSYPARGELFPFNAIGRPICWIDPGVRESMTVTPGAVTVTAIRSCLDDGCTFTEASAPPDLLDAAGTGANLIRPALSFVAASSEKMTSFDLALRTALGGANPFTLVLALRRTAVGAAHTVLSVGTTGTDNGRWDITLDASDDTVITRVNGAGSSTASTYATTINGTDVHVITFDGTTPLYFLNTASAALSGTAAGDVGTPTRVVIGARHYNTSTIGQYAAMELSDLMVFDQAVTGPKLVALLAYFRRRYGR